MTTSVGVIYDEGGASQIVVAGRAYSLDRLAALLPLAEAALAHVRADHTFHTTGSARAAVEAQKALVAAACATDPDVAHIVAQAEARWAELRRNHEAALAALDEELPE